MLHLLRMVSHTLRVREPSNGVHRHTQERWCRIRVVRIRVHRVRLDATVGGGARGHIRSGRTERDGRGGRRVVHPIDGELRLPLPTPTVVLLHPSGHSEYHPRHRGWHRRILVVRPQRCQRLLLGGHGR